MLTKKYLLTRIPYLASMMTSKHGFYKIKDGEIETQKALQHVILSHKSTDDIFKFDRFDWLFQESRNFLLKNT